MAYNVDNNTVSHYVEDGQLSEEFIEALESLSLSGEVMFAGIIQHDCRNYYSHEMRIAWELYGFFDIVYSERLRVVSDETVSELIEDINSSLSRIAFDVTDPLPTLESDS